tara:strand:- start:2638 stop:3885 length:1248 start_codon:yes stop_codon:yes gene_type:complete
VARSTTFKYTVTVVSSGGNKYAIDGNTQQYVVLFPGCTYEFNQDDSSNSGHPLRFSETPNGSHAGGSEYTTGVTTSGTPGSATAFTKIEVTGSTPYILYYYCTQHSAMGGTVNMPSSANTDRAVLMGGLNPSATSTCDYVAVSSTGNAVDFGDLIRTQTAFDARGSNTVRAICAGGSGAASPSTDISEIIFATQGNGADYGDLNATNARMGGNSNSLRAVFGGGENPSGRNSNMDAVMITSGGNAVDYGDMTTTGGASGGLASTTRIVWSGADIASGYTNVMQYGTIATNGNAVDFGDQSVTRGWPTGVSNNTRGVFAGGFTYAAPTATYYNQMDYITIASTGNATDFGDLVSNMRPAGTSNKTRAVFMGGDTGSASNVIQYITIASTSNTTDFGDLTEARMLGSAVCGSHGGIE